MGASVLRGSCLTLIRAKGLSVCTQFLTWAGEQGDITRIRSIPAIITSSYCRPGSSVPSAQCLDHPLLLLHVASHGLAPAGGQACQPHFTVMDIVTQGGLTQRKARSPATDSPAQGRKLGPSPLQLAH